METIGFIGSGNIGTAVARLAIESGYQVIMSNSRGPETLQGLVEMLGDSARAGTLEEVAQLSDMIVVAVPFYALEQIPNSILADKIVLDTMNFDPNRDGNPPIDLVEGKVTTSELVQNHLNESKIVKVFNTIFSSHINHLARPKGSQDRSALPIAGDDSDAKAQVERFLDNLGWDSVDAGSLADSWRMALGKPAFVAPYLRVLDFSQLATDPGKPVSSSEIKNLLDSATR